MSDSEKTQRAGKDALNFTKAATEALLMPQKGWKYYCDTKVSGLAIRIGPSGVKTFILDLKVNCKK
ncbi:Arm DNA-binding domain-containing protein [Burkholderia diffusa]|uniref:Arm DNA-binding domain-containing protein n=1 Tax=Burkholderia diffusa TaxID=488732 RepID=UPI001FD34F5A|nr:Arm DNA-binding domain-containing protein [Burkholderia diffusa]